MDLSVSRVTSGLLKHDSRVMAVGYIILCRYKLTPRLWNENRPRAFASVRDVIARESKTMREVVKS